VGVEPVPRADGVKERPSRRLGDPDVTWSDARLVNACLGGNELAWATLIAKYKNLIYSIPLKYGAPPQDAADIFQSVCLELFAELPRLRNPDALRRWIINVTAHQAYHWKKKVRRRNEHDLMEIDEEQLSADPPADMLEDIEREQMLREAVASLPTRCQEIVRLLFYQPEPISYNDLAAKLGLARGSIGFIRGRCLDRLERALNHLGFTRARR
jgi:RNA polymerase sigma factor (sigma-70 family)